MFETLQSDQWYANVKSEFSSISFIFFKNNDWPLVGGNPFSVSTANSDATGLTATSVVGLSQNLPSNCNNDYILFPGASDPSVVPNNPANAVDRYCGEFLNPVAAATQSTTICSK